MPVERQKRKEEDLEISELPLKKIGCPLLLGEDIDKQVQAYLMKLREAYLQGISIPPYGRSLEYWRLLVMMQEIEPPHRKKLHKVEIWRGTSPTTIETRLSTDTVYLSFGLPSSSFTQH